MMWQYFFKSPLSSKSTPGTMALSLIFPRLLGSAPLEIVLRARCPQEKLWWEMWHQGCFWCLTTLPCGSWHVDKTAFVPRGNSWTFSVYSTKCEGVDFGVGGRFWHAESYPSPGQRNRCTIWFWVWHPGFDPSSSAQLIKVQTIKSEDVKDKRVSPRCHKILFKIILSRSILTFTFSF